MRRPPRPGPPPPGGRPPLTAVPAAGDDDPVAYAEAMARRLRALGRHDSARVLELLVEQGRRGRPSA